MDKVLKDVLLLVVGSCILVEGVASLMWKHNDKWWFPQTVRVLRTVSGGLIICLVLL